MVDKIKTASRNTKKNIQVGYEVVAIGAASAAAAKVAFLPKVNGFHVWQLIAGVVFAGVAAQLFALKAKE